MLNNIIASIPGWFWLCLILYVCYRIIKPNIDEHVAVMFESVFYIGFPLWLGWLVADWTGVTVVAVTIGVLIFVVLVELKNNDNDTKEIYKILERMKNEQNRRDSL